VIAKQLKNAERGGQEFTAQPLTTPAVNGTTPLRDSETFRLPKPKARCPLSGLSRTSLLEYGEAGCFKLIRLRKRGSRRGIVLVDTASFLRWLHGQPAVTEEQP
jgi:hypothetical protein